jgi:pyruvate dehydrogenase E2 component (dihydrolipoamide acetyltransferase)
MPALGADMEAGVLLEWLVHPGDRVRRGDIVAVVDTSKAAIEVECFDGGVVERLLVEPGTRVPVGAPLAIIDVGAGAAADQVTPAATGPATTPFSAPAEPVSRSDHPGRGGTSPVTSPLVRRQATAQHVDLTSVHGTGPGGRVTRADIETGSHPRPVAPPGRVAASPLARRLAIELGVDLTSVAGTGPRGAVGADDVRQAAAAHTPGAVPLAGPPSVTAPAVGATPTDRTDSMRKAIAALMARSKREIPHYYLTETVDLAIAMDFLRQRNLDLPVSQRLVPAAMLLKAAARGARAVPDLNGFYTDEHFTPAASVHLGVAVSLRGGGLVAPAIHDADQLALTDLMARLKDLVMRTRSGRLRRAELADPTITVSNLGERGVESILGVIYPPQVALVGFGRIIERPLAIAGMIGVHPTVIMSLAADHRVTDGATGARYLTTINELLQQPEEL